MRSACFVKIVKRIAFWKGHIDFWDLERYLIFPVHKYQLIFSCDQNNGLTTEEFIYGTPRFCRTVPKVKESPVQ